MGACKPYVVGKGTELLLQSWGNLEGESGSGPHGKVTRWIKRWILFLLCKDDSAYLLGTQCSVYVAKETLTCQGLWPFGN